MQIAVIGDGLINVDTFKSVLVEYFPGARLTGFDTNWPEEPFHNDHPEVREFSGDEEAVVDLVPPADALVTHSAPVTEKVLDAGPSLRAVACPRGGPVNVNVAACTRRGIPVFYGPGRNVSAVVEFTLGLTLAHLKNIALGHAALKQGEWLGELYRYDRVGPELPEILVGIVGFGHIGRRVAQVFAQLGAPVAIYDPFVPAESIEEEGYQALSLKQLLAEADVVSLHARLTPESRHLIGPRELDLMKEGACLVNTARGQLVDNEALTRALQRGEIGSAALDVFHPEPIPAGHPILSLENVTLTPHIGGASRTTVSRSAHMVSRDLAAFFAGKPVENCLNPEVLARDN